MRKVLSAGAVACGAALALMAAACKAPDGADASRRTARPAANTVKTEGKPQGAPRHNDGVRRMTVAELKAALDKNDGSVVVADTRNKNEFDAGHIKGAISTPRGELAKLAGELPK